MLLNLLCLLKQNKRLCRQINTSQKCRSRKTCVNLINNRICILPRQYFTARFSCEEKRVCRKGSSCMSPSGFIIQSCLQFCRGESDSFNRNAIYILWRRFLRSEGKFGGGGGSGPAKKFRFLKLWQKFSHARNPFVLRVRAVQTGRFEEAAASFR